MELIDKAALVTEIEKRIEAHKETLKNCDSSISEMVLKGSMSAYQSLLHFLNALEVKEVDKNNEIVDKLNDIINFHKEKVFKGQWYKWMPEKISYHNGIISGIKQCLSIIRNR